MSISRDGDNSQIISAYCKYRQTLQLYICEMHMHLIPLSLSLSLSL